MKEKTMQTLFRDYIKKHPPHQTEVYELKICKGTSLPFTSVADHQVEALIQAEEGLFYKIPDQPISWGANTKLRFAAKKPFDCLYIVKSNAYVIIWFYTPRTKKVFIKIPIFAWLDERNTSNRKSLTELKALELGEKIYV